MAETEKETKGRLDDFATNIVKPIMQAMFGAAFDCIAQYEEGSGEILVPYALKEGVLETLDDITKSFESHAGWSDAASLIGFAAGRDGMKQGREYRRMARVTKALRDLIKAKNDQLKGEIADMKEQSEHAKLTAMADKLGF